MIVKGGIVDPTTWAVDKETKSCRQILFILKEAPVRETFDLIDHLYKGGRAATYAAVAMWSYLLRHYGLSAKSTDWEIVKSKKNKREQNLQHVAVININDFYKKKAKGKHSNDKILLEEYSEQRHRAIERKITEISPSIIVTGGKQYKVQQGDVLFVEKLEAEEGAEVKFDTVLAVGEEGAVKFGAPSVEGASVAAKVVKNGKGKKLNIITYRPKKGSARRMGHRQPYTKVEITAING